MTPLVVKLTISPTELLARRFYEAVNLDATPETARSVNVPTFQTPFARHSDRTVIWCRADVVIE